MLDGQAAQKESTGQDQGNGNKPRLPVKPRNNRGAGCEDQTGCPAHGDVYPEKIGDLGVRDALPLDRRRGKTRVLKDTQKAQYGRDHGEEAKILWCEHSCQHHDGREL